ncbi:MAG: glutamine-hydrolyzing carbamoyl-phosphate synthase small subunit [Planctomycetota bacterium]
MNSRKPARLVLEDGTVLRGRSFGASRETIGELVFNTSITGYQEILTDPSYRGQTVLLTQPHIGNYGVNSEDEESARVWLSGLIVREAAERSSNFRSGGELGDYLRQHDVPGIERVDTRCVTRRVRAAGALRVLITEDIETPDELLVARVRQAPSVSDEDHVRIVSTKQVIEWSKGHESPFAASSPGAANVDGRRHAIVAYDFGAKRNILRSLVAAGFDVTVVPADTPAEAVLERKPAGVFLSNGPGDPAILDYAVSAARGLVGKVPVFGICLGHQILGQVFGAKTFKMKFGHHGGNQPVMDLTTEKVEITSQNHSFAVDPSQLPDAVEVTHRNLNDQTVEGIRHREMPVFSVQYHPEAAPGPHDSLYLFDRFRALIDGSSGT